MNSLFSVFDPVSLVGLPLNWLSLIFLLFVLPVNFWLLKTQFTLFLGVLSNTLAQEFKSVISAKAVPGTIWVSLSAFLLIWSNNFFGLMPYVFTATSHLMLTMSLALPLWLGHIIMAWVKTPSPSFAHLVPLGSPAALAPFMVMIELVSSLIRPLTLSVRLAANMIAGHLLMVLLSSPLTSAAWGMTFLILSVLILLAFLETAVATIQAYVFSLLSVLYVNEVDTKQIY